MTTLGDGIEVRAFRGTRRASVYREHVVPLSRFERMLAAAARQGMPGLASLAPVGSRELAKDEARRLAAELTRLRASAELVELDDDLTALAEVAHWCGRAREDAWLRIVGPGRSA